MAVLVPERVRLFVGCGFGEGLQTMIGILVSCYLPASNFICLQVSHLWSSSIQETNKNKTEVLRTSAPVVVDV